jgi:organic hydroperoxide reductase OsmC/OhrA
MLIEARVENRQGQHRVTLATDGAAQPLQVPPAPNGFGSSANGGELLCLALATCYCNDVYREAGRRGITVTRVDVEVRAAFGAAGEPARSLEYRASVHARAAAAEIRELMLHTDRVAEVQNTLRRGMEVRFEVGGAHAAA